jgi:hypothetical protein
MDQRNRSGEDQDLDRQMERDTEIRRDTQVRGSLGMPPSGGSSSESPNRDEAVPEFEREQNTESPHSDEDRMSER